MNTRKKDSRKKVRGSSKNIPKTPKQIKRKKAQIKKSQNKLTVHHRRPVSLGGVTRESNISNITEEIHRAWTILMSNMNAEQICNHINTYFKPKRVTLICTFINGSRCTKMGVCGSLKHETMSYAWKVLFRNYPRFKDKIDYINNVLLDPAYHLYIRD